MPSAAGTATPPLGGVQWTVVAVALAGAAALAAGVAADAARNGVALLIVGLLLGVVLHQAAFGFTSAWRIFISEGRTASLRAQLLMLGVACLLFFPTLAALPHFAWAMLPAERADAAGQSRPAHSFAA